jgi:hypothetical protein
MSSASRRRRRRQLEMSERCLSVAHDDDDTGVKCDRGHRRAGREEQRRRQSWGQIAVSRKFMPWGHETQCRRSAAIVPFAISAARSPWSSSLTFVWAIRSLARSLTRSVPSIHALPTHSLGGSRPRSLSSLRLPFTASAQSIRHQISCLISPPNTPQASPKSTSGPKLSVQQVPTHRSALRSRALSAAAAAAAVVIAAVVIAAAVIAATVIWSPPLRLVSCLSRCRRPWLRSDATQSLARRPQTTPKP